jgi:hypothetical protein
VDLTEISRKMEQAFYLAFPSHNNMFGQLNLEDIPQKLYSAKHLSLTSEKNIDDLVKYLSQIQTLHIENVQLSDSLSKLENLTELSIKNDSIEELPSWISKFKKLKILTLNCKKLKKLPENFGDLKHLKNISLDSCNPGLEIPKSTQKIKSIDNLYIYASIPKGIHNIKKINQLHIEDVNIIPESFNAMEINYFYISSEKLPKNFSFVKGVDTLELNLWSNSTNLETPIWIVY